MLLESAAVLAGRYRLERRLANGQVGEVWVATDTELARRVAIKILHVAFKGDAEVRERFKAKSRRAASLEHVNLARIFDYGEPESPECPNGPFLVMELVDGPSVADLLSAGPLGAVRAMNIVAQVAAALDIAHRAAIVHGDISPQHILLTEDGDVKLVDLVAAGQTTRGMAGQAVPADDLYWLGVAAIQCLTGAPLERPGADQAVVRDLGDGKLPVLPGTVPESVANLVKHLTAKDPAERPANAGLVATRARELRDQLVKANTTSLPVTLMPDGLAMPRRTIRGVPGPRRPTPAELAFAPATVAEGAAAGGSAVAPRAGHLISARISGLIVLALAGLVGYWLVNASRPQVAGTVQTAMVTVKAADLAGTPVPTARLRLTHLGLTVRVQWRPSAQVAPGRVVSVSPVGHVQVGSLVTLVGSLSPHATGPAAPVSSNAHHRAKKHQRLPSASGTSSPSPAPTPSTPSIAPSPTPTPTDSPPPSPSPPPGSPTPPTNRRPLQELDTAGN